MPEEVTYEILLPGFEDFIKVPGLNSPELKRERIKRMKAADSPIPEALQWMPGVINVLDDAQDLLITALTLGKPFLRRLPARFVPGLGWILLANDVLNLGTGLLSMALTGKFGKKTLLETFELMTGGRARRMRQVGKFLSGTNWLGFGLQAGQALETLTGYGLVLGAAMGAVSDSFWGAIRFKAGQQVRFVGPPKNDVVSKAARYMFQSTNMPNAGQVLSIEDHELLILANSIGAQVINSFTQPDVLDLRAAELADTEFPVFEPWEQSSRQALEEEGLDPAGPLRPFVPTDNPTPTVLDATQYAAARIPGWYTNMGARFGTTTRATAFSMATDQAGSQAFEWLESDPAVLQPIFSRDEIGLARAAECNVFPPGFVFPAQLKFWLDEAHIQAVFDGYQGATCKSLKMAADTVFGGWHAIP